MICCLCERGSSLVPTGYLLLDHLSAQCRTVKSSFGSAQGKQTNQVPPSFSFQPADTRLSLWNSGFFISEPLICAEYLSDLYIFLLLLNKKIIKCNESRGQVKACTSYLDSDARIQRHTHTQSLSQPELTEIHSLSGCLWGYVQSVSVFWTTLRSLSLHVPKQN